MQNSKSTNVAIDITKLIFCFCVVLLHSEAYTLLPHSYWVEEVLLRLAVPFFFVTSGYFWGAKLQNASGDSIETIKNTVFDF